MVSDPDNPLVLSLLKASSTAYSYNPTEKIDEVLTSRGLNIDILAAIIDL